jgi:histidine triad (HIT) family protein
VDNDCLFCRISAGEIPATVVHETDTTLAFRDIDPKAPVHVLVIPKDHHPDVAALTLADPAVAADVLAAAAAVAEAEGLRGDGYRLIFNSGRYAGQEVFHAHGHVLGGAPLGPMLALR